MKFRVLIISLVALFWLTGCEGTTDSKEQALDSWQQNLMTELLEAKAKWQALSVYTYQFEIDRYCECLDDYTEYLVLNYPTQVLSFNRRLEVYETPLKYDEFELTSVENLFVLIEHFIPSAESVHVQYDKSSGHPTNISIDVDVNIADEEIILDISNLTYETETLNCTTQVVPGFQLKVVDLSGDSPINLTCSADITLTQFEFQESIEASDGGLVGTNDYIEAVYERAGTYEISVEVDGYQAKTLTDVNVHRGLCHVTTNELEIEVSKLE